MVRPGYQIVGYEGGGSAVTADAISKWWEPTLERARAKRDEIEASGDYDRVLVR